MAALRGLGLGLSESGELASLCVGGRCEEMAAQLRQHVVDRRREIATPQAELAHLDTELANLGPGSRRMRPSALSASAKEVIFVLRCDCPCDPDCPCDCC